MTLRELFSHFNCKSELEYISIKVNDGVSIKFSYRELCFEGYKYLDYEVKNWIFHCEQNTLDVDLLVNKGEYK